VKLDYHFAALLGHKLSPKWTFGAGYRYLFVDYRPTNLSVFNVVTLGALLGVTYSFKRRVPQAQTIASRSKTRKLQLSYSRISAGATACHSVSGAGYWVDRSPDFYRCGHTSQASGLIAADYKFDLILAQLQFRRSFHPDALPGNRQSTARFACIMREVNSAD
jgi:hypothetical protein